MTSPMDEDYPADAPGYLPSPCANWEGGCTDGTGQRWVHVPHQGWRKQRPVFEPAPTRRRLTISDLWDDLPPLGRVVVFGVLPAFAVLAVTLIVVLAVIS